MKILARYKINASVTRRSNFLPGGPVQTVRGLDHRSPLNIRIEALIFKRRSVSNLA